MLQKALINDDLEIIKIKSLLRITYTEFPLDFDPDIYRRLNSDLTHLSDRDAISHFKENGMSEGRCYKQSRDVINSHMINIFNMLQIEVPKSLCPSII